MFGANFGVEIIASIWQASTSTEIWTSNGIFACSESRQRLKLVFEQTNFIHVRLRSKFARNLYRHLHTNECFCPQKYTERVENLTIISGCCVFAVTTYCRLFYKQTMARRAWVDAKCTLLHSTSIDKSLLLFALVSCHIGILCHNDSYTNENPINSRHSGWHTLCAHHPNASQQQWHTKKKHASISMSLR